MTTLLSGWRLGTPRCDSHRVRGERGVWVEKEVERREEGHFRSKQVRHFEGKVVYSRPTLGPGYRISGLIEPVNLSGNTPLKSMKCPTRYRKIDIIQPLRNINDNEIL